MKLFLHCYAQENAEHLGNFDVHLEEPVVDEALQRVEQEVFNESIDGRLCLQEVENFALDEMNDVREQVLQARLCLKLSQYVGKCLIVFFNPQNKVGTAVLVHAGGSLLLVCILCFFVFVLRLLILKCGLLCFIGR